MSTPLPSPRSATTQLAVLAGGVGAARMLRGVRRVLADDEITAIVNTGDDIVLHGLHISPDLDTVTYTLAGAISQEHGWGLEGETWHAMESLARYGGETWFRLRSEERRVGKESKPPESCYR